MVVLLKDHSTIGLKLMTWIPDKSIIRIPILLFIWKPGGQFQGYWKPSVTFKQCVVKLYIYVSMVPGGDEKFSVWSCRRLKGYIPHPGVVQAPKRECRNDIFTIAPKIRTPLPGSYTPVSVASPNHNHVDCATSLYSVTQPFLELSNKFSNINCPLSGLILEPRKPRSED